MKFLEKDLEEIIFNATHDELNDRGLNLPGRKYRQLKIGSYGIADLVYVYSEYRDIELKESKPPLKSYYLEKNRAFTITVVELKKDKVGISAFLQAVRYCKGIKRYLKIRGVKIDYKFEIVLVGSEVDTDSDIIFLTDLINNYDFNGYLSCLEMYSYNYSFDGIEFNSHNSYKITEESFNI